MDEQTPGGICMVNDPTFDGASSLVFYVSVGIQTGHSGCIRWYKGETLKVLIHCAEWGS